MPDCSKEKLTLQVGIKPSSLCDARGLLFRDKVSTFSSSSSLEFMIITSQMQNSGNEVGASKGKDPGGMHCLWRDSIYQLRAEGLICCLAPAVTSALLWVLSLCFHFSFVFQLLIYVRRRDQEQQGKTIQPKYLTTGSGLYSLLLSKVTEELTRELRDKVDAVFPGVDYCAVCTEPSQWTVQSSCIWKKEKNKKRERKPPYVCCSGEYFNIWNSQPV